MKNVIAAVALATVAAVIIKKVSKAKKQKEGSEYTHHLYTDDREMSYFKKGKKSGSKKSQYA